MMVLAEGLFSLLTAGNIFLLVLLLITLSWLWDLYEFRGMPPGPRYTCLPVIGNLLSVINDDVKFTRMRKEYGPVLALKAGSWKMVSASSPEAIKEILVTKSAHYAGRPPFYSFLFESLGGKDIVFGNYGPAWKLHRKLFMTSLRQYVSNTPLIESRVSEQANKLLQFFEEQKGRPFNPSEAIMKRLADVVCGITFGEYFNSSHPDFAKFIELTNHGFSDADMNEQVSLLDLFPFAKYFPFKAYKESQKVADFNRDLFRKLLENGKQDFDESQPVNNLMSGLLKARVEAECENEEENQALLSDDYLVMTLNDMVSAGFETTGSALKWAILFLVNYPKYQKEIHTEMDEVLGADRMPSLSDRHKIPIIQAAIMEILRLGNVATDAVPHYTLQDTTLCGHRIPKDTVVLIDLEALHLNPKCWENPTEFNPHRHLDSEGQLITNQGNWLPFSAGRRVCPGESLAKVELFLFLSWMLHKFEFLPEEGQPPPDMEGIRAFTQSPKPYMIRAIKRK